MPQHVIAGFYTDPCSLAHAAAGNSQELTLLSSLLRRRGRCTVQHATVVHPCEDFLEKGIQGFFLVCARGGGSCGSFLVQSHS